MSPLPPPARFPNATDMRNYSRTQRAAGKTIALVPTMVRAVHNCACETALYCAPLLKSLMRRTDAGYAMPTGIIARGSPEPCQCSQARACLWTAVTLVSLVWMIYSLPVDCSCRARADIVVASIYVNPTQARSSLASTAACCAKSRRSTDRALLRVAVLQGRGF